MNKSKILLLFDIDGTLTPPRKKITENMLFFLQELIKNKNIDLGFVGGSDLEKQIEQLGDDNFYLFKWRFSENGLESYYNNELIKKESFSKKFGETHFKKLINICLYVLSTLDSPIKRGTFIEYRNGMLNISPIGRACSQEERDEFEKFDFINNLRKKMISDIQLLWNEYVILNNLHELKLNFSIGGQISVDVFPEGWDKTYCLQFLQDKYEKIHFFGDKTDINGNDYEIYIDSRVIGHKVIDYNDTINILTHLF